MSETKDETRTAGRGLIAIAGAKIYFIVASYAIQLVLPRLLGSAASFGLYSKAMSAISILNNVLIAATIQSVSKFVSENEMAGPARLRQGLRLQVWLGGGLAVLVYALSAPLARFHRDPALEPLLEVSAVVVVSYALYATFVGSLNGRRLFQKQASLDATFSTLRTVGILGGAGALGMGAFGATAGFASAAAIIMCVAAAVVGLGAKGETLPLRTWLAFLMPIWLYQGLLNGILQLDVQVLAKTVTELGLADGMAQEAASERANEYVGFYRAAQTFAFVPYQLILSMTFIVFPMVSRATSSGDVEAAQRTIRQAMRFSLLVLLAVAAPIAGAADGVMRIAYPPEYLVGAPALGILVLGIAAFALFVIAATVLSSAGQPTTAAAIAGVGLAVVVAGNYLLVAQAGVGDGTLSAAALGTSAGMLVAFLLAGLAVYARFKTLLPPATVVRGIVAAGAAAATAHFVPHGSRVLALGALAAGFLAFVACLFLLREMKGADVAAIKKVLGRG